MRVILKLIFIVLGIITFTACSDSENGSDSLVGSTSYRINMTENRDVPIDALIVSIGDEEAQVRLTRDVEQETLNVYVISGSVRVTEGVEE